MNKKTMTIYCTPEAIIARVIESGPGCKTVTREYRIHGLSIRRFYALSGGTHTAVSVSSHSYDIYRRRLGLDTAHKKETRMSKDEYEQRLDKIAEKAYQDMVTVQTWHSLRC